MARLDFPTYLQHIDDESQKFRDVLADCDPAAAVPSCSEWRAADLLWHLGEVQHWWTSVVVNRPKGPDDYVQPDRPGDYEGLLAFYDEQRTALVEALGQASPDEPATTWHPDHQNVAFIYRRQAHAALIHRRDAELTAHTISPFPADLAADGVDEVLDVMYGGGPPRGGVFPLPPSPPVDPPHPHYIRIDLTDTGDRVWVQLGRFHGTDADGIEHDEDDLHVVTDPGLEP